MADDQVRVGSAIGPGGAGQQRATAPRSARPLAIQRFCFFCLRLCSDLVVVCYLRIDRWGDAGLQDARGTRPLNNPSPPRPPTMKKKHNTKQQGFGWAIAKALAEAGAEISLGVWVRELREMKTEMMRGKEREGRRCGVVRWGE